MPISNKALEIAQKIAHEVWQKYDDKYGYRTEKQKRNGQVQPNDPENMWFYWNQFDSANQDEFSERVCGLPESTEKEELKEWITETFKEYIKLYLNSPSKGIPW